jgi:ankyrin repeat protein
MNKELRKAIRGVLKTLLLLVFMYSTPCYAFFEANLSYEKVLYHINNGENVHQRNYEGLTPLMYAAEHSGDPRILSALIKAGAEVDAKERLHHGDNGWTALMFAAAKAENPEILSVLIDAGADLEAEGGFDPWKTPLTCAATYNTNPEILDILLKAGANLHKPDGHYSTPLMCAAGENHNPKILSMLIDAGARVNVMGGTEMEGAWTPLMGAAYSNKAQIVQLLLNAGAKVNMQNIIGETALIVLTKNDTDETPADPGVIVVLLNAGANAAAEDSSGMRAVDYAEENALLTGTPELELLKAKTLSAGLMMQVMEKNRSSKEGTNVRDKPEGKVIFTIPGQTKNRWMRAVRVSEQRGDWFSVELYDGRKGWMHTSVLGCFSSSTWRDGTKEAPFLFKAADYKAEREAISENQPMFLRGTDGTWAKVACTDKNGKKREGWLPRESRALNPEK